MNPIGRPLSDDEVRRAIRFNRLALESGALTPEMIPQPHRGVLWAVNPLSGVAAALTSPAGVRMIARLQALVDTADDGMVGRQTLVAWAGERPTFDPGSAAGDRVSLPRYAPHSDEAVALFLSAANLAGLPDSWATGPGVHHILSRESGGWVGRPNYTYDAVYGVSVHHVTHRDRWPEIHADLRRGRIRARSSATGLGQLLLSNMERYAPSGARGIGVAVEEAVAMLRYIKARYRDPKTAWEVYQLPVDPECGAPWSWRALEHECKRSGGY